MSERITRSRFRAELGEASIDVKMLDPATVRAIEDAAAEAIAQGLADPVLRQLASQPGGIAAELERIAGSDGRIASGSRGGQAEIDALFRFLDRFDTNGRGDSFVASAAAPGTTHLALTPAGKALAALKAERRHRDTVKRDEFVRMYGGGAFEIDRLNGAAATLAKLGVDVPALMRLADESGRIYGERALTRIFVMLERLDERGADGRLDQRVLHRAGEAAPGTTVAGEALQLLASSFRPYDRSDGKALVDPNVAPITLAARHRAQTTPTGCYRTATQMVEQFSKGLSRHLSGPTDATYVSRGESEDGRVYGFAEDFRHGRDVIDATLASGRPIIVGISHSVTAVANFDRITDHFVVITGRGVEPDGRVYYTFHDPGTTGRQSEGARLYVDGRTGVLFRPGDPDKAYPLNLPYEVTQVRSYRDQARKSPGTA